MTVLGIDSVTDAVIISSVSGGPMGKGPGKDGVIDLTSISFVIFSRHLCGSYLCSCKWRSLANWCHNIV